ncbi:hypothetical protein HN018_22790 (plasmid) [Lichenicola cladoniae]|uniref:Uncharacterized protein n=1 Tax=Lichenicola cladoniae TaxID=1484109 RepID=A0A6M8HY61_9PROT|nr:hypothetical protein [Lichenicola cladoniae]NPD69330.1 hypothetical protein [Acetobacteraceae bacterium]QKE93031.1 hypothetical protein HN018_22790 [Lichenicola cladoniae]
MLMVLPYGNGSRVQPTVGPGDTLDVGAITLNLPAFAGFPDGSAYSGSIAAGLIAGTVHDALDEAHAPWADTPGPGGVIPRAIVTAPLILPGTISTSLSVLNGALVPVALSPLPGITT